MEAKGIKERILKNLYYNTPSCWDNPEHRNRCAERTLKLSQAYYYLTLAEKEERSGVLLEQAGALLNDR